MCVMCGQTCFTCRLARAINSDAWYFGRGRSPSLYAYTQRAPIQAFTHLQCGSFQVCNHVWRMCMGLANPRYVWLDGKSLGLAKIIYTVCIRFFGREITKYMVTYRCIYGSGQPWKLY